MSLEALVWAFEQPVEPPARKLVLVYLGKCADSEWRCWPRQDAIAQKALIKERMVRRHLEALERDGYLSIEMRGPRTAVYTLRKTGISVPGIDGTTVPVIENEDRYSSTPDTLQKTGTPVPKDRYSSTDTSLLRKFKKVQKKTPSRTPADAHEEIPETPAWLQKLTFPVWKSLTQIHIAELEAQANKLGLDLTGEALACEAYMNQKKRDVKLPFNTLKNWLDKSHRMREERRNGDAGSNSAQDQRRPAANGAGGGRTWAEVIANRGRRVV